MSDKIFVGSGKVFGKYGQIGVNICLSDLPEEHIFTSDKNNKKYIKLNISQKRQPDNYGNTHSVEVNTWKPDPQGGNGG